MLVAKQHSSFPVLLQIVVGSVYLQFVASIMPKQPMECMCAFEECILQVENTCIKKNYLSAAVGEHVRSGV